MKEEGECLKMRFLSNAPFRNVKGDMMLFYMWAWMLKHIPTRKTCRYRWREFVCGDLPTKWLKMETCNTNDI
jgi:hypothetical protein